MLITQAEFTKLYDSKTLRLAFVGMSNIGKSYCARVLHENLDFVVWEVDDQIQKTIEVSDIANSSNWLGYPFDERYAQNSAEYLRIEVEKTMNPIIPEDKNFILDTTGSSIYLSSETHEWMKKNFLIIALDTPDSLIEDMIETFFSNPKPVIWREGIFQQQAGESTNDALRRCYPALLEDRLQRYRELADIIVPRQFSRDRDLPVEELMSSIFRKLPVQQDVEA